MFIDYDMTVDELFIKISKGEKYFFRIDFGEGEFKNKNLDNVIFEQCIMTIDFSKSTFRNSKFVDSNIKCCIFHDSDLTNATIENCSVERVDLSGAIVEGIIFNNNSCYSSILNHEDIDLLIQ